MTIREKNKQHIINKNTLRNKLNDLKLNQKVAVIYKEKIIGIGLPRFLLHETSNFFAGLLNNEIKEEINGVTLYIKI